MKTLTALAFAAWLMSITGTAQAAERLLPTKTPQSLLQVKVTRGSLTFDAKDAPLDKVFEEIGKQAGIVVEGNIGPAEPVTMRFENVALEEGIKRLSNNVTIYYGDKPNDKGHKITKVVVLAEDKRKVASPQSVKTAAPIKPREPEVRPEPFKFEFDPTQATKK